MPLSASQCSAFSDFLGRRPFNWDKKISRDRKPSDYLYTGMYRTENWPNHTGTSHLHERVYVTRPNDNGQWSQFVADPCVGAPCDSPRAYIGHGVDQLRYDRYYKDYQSPVFCLDQLNTVEEGIAKMNAIADGYKELPEMITAEFIRSFVLRKAGSSALSGASGLSGLSLAGLQDAYGNPVIIDVSDNMFAIGLGGGFGTQGALLINLNANGQLTGTNGPLATAIPKTSDLANALGQLSMEYLNNMQEDLAANGYHSKEWLPAGKFSITTDATTRRRLLVANPALTGMYKGADFAKGGAFYSYGVTSGCGDWLFKEDKEQMRFRFRSDLDGKDMNGNALTNAIWIEQVWPFTTTNATFGKKSVYSTDWKNAPIRFYHVYNRDARVVYVGDIESVNSEMKFGLARSFMGKWTWHSPDYFQATDPNTGVVCSYQNDKKNKGYWLGEYNLGIKTIYPEIERCILALGEPQPYVRIPRTNTAPNAPTSITNYQSLLPYNALCNDTGWIDFTTPGYPIED